MVDTPRQPRPDLPKRTRRESGPELDAAAQRERWENTPNESWFSKWAPLPPGVQRGPYAKPTRALLRAVETGLLRRLNDEQQRDEDGPGAPPSRP